MAPINGRAQQRMGGKVSITRSSAWFVFRNQEEFSCENGDNALFQLPNHNKVKLGVLQLP